MANFDWKKSLYPLEREYFEWHTIKGTHFFSDSRSIETALRRYHDEVEKLFSITLNSILTETTFLTEVHGHLTSYPRANNAIGMYLLFSIIGLQRWMQAKYTSLRFDVQPTDIVFDCGAFNGGFSSYAAARGATVIAFEPSKRNFIHLETNTKNLNIRKYSRGLNSKDGYQDFFESSSATDSSFLTPDTGEILKNYQVQICRLDTLVRSEKLPIPTFLKLEAEGNELDILKGIGDLKIKKISVDASDEGGILNNCQRINKKLENLGYFVTREVNMLYAELIEYDI